MVHIRAKNLPEKGRVLKWLFNSDMIESGDDFALVELQSEQQVIIKTHLSGCVMRTIKLGTVVKNGTILANVAVGSKEIGKFKNKNFKEGEEPINLELDSLEITSDGLENLISIDDELDEITEADVKKNVSLFNNSELMPSRDYNVMEYRDEEKNNNLKTESGSSGAPTKNRFAEMRANIANSIKNAPNLNGGNLSDEEKSKLANMSNSDAASSGNLFSTDNASGMSKFRQLVQSRKEKLLEENDFQEVNINDEPVDAMSRLDEKGRPLIMRNIIASRLEKFNASGGDPKAVNSLAQQQDADAAKPLKPSSILMDGNPKYIKQDEETPDIFKSKNRILTNPVEDSPFMRQKGSEDGDFRATFGAYVDDDEHLELDSNDLSNSGAVVMPHKRGDEILSDLSKKPTKSYAELKLSNLYDTNRRWELFSSRNEVAEINRRKHMVEEGTLGGNNPIFGASLKIGGVEVPEKFLKEVMVKKSDGTLKTVQYKDTTVGHREFEDWLKSKNLMSTWKVLQNRNKSYGSLNQKNNQIQTQIEALQEDITVQVNELQEEVAVKPAERNTQEFKSLSKEIRELKKELEKSKKQNNKFFSGESNDSSFTQMMQLFMMQNLMNNNNGNNNSSQNFNEMSNSLKYLLKSELENFKQQIALENEKERQLLIEKEKRIFLEKEKEAKLLLAKETAKLIEKDKKRESLINHQTEKIIKAEKERALLLQKEKERLIQKERELAILRANLIGNKEEIEKDYNDKKSSLEKAKFNKNINKNKNDNKFKNGSYKYNEKEKNVHRRPVNPNSNSAVKSMIMSKNYIPPLTIGTEVDMTSILKLKHVLKKKEDGVLYPTILFIAKALSFALTEYPKINSSYDPETNEVLEKGFHNIGLATETTDGLIIPVLKNVEKLSLKKLAIEIQEITLRLRRGELYNYETSGSTITLANYGNIGAIQATPTIFYPNAAVVGVGKVVKKPIVVDNEKLAIKAIMNISLTVDQRIIDNTTAGNFLARIKEILERPEMLAKS